MTYANEAKENLVSVSHETLETKGAVSKETAAEMCVGCAKAAKADMGLSTTGIAGPGGGTKEKPVGLVYLGCSLHEQVTVERGEASEIPAKTAPSTPKSTMKTLTIYSIDSDTMSLIPVVVKKEEKTLTAEYITYLVTQNLEDEDVRVDHVEQQKNVVVVSFDSKAKPVKRCSKQMETLILNCFASSLLDNVKNCKKIIYRCKNKRYKSSHRSFGFNEVYASA